MQLDRLTLPDDGWVEFKDTDELTTRQYLAVKALMTTDLLQTISRAQTLLAQFLVSAWEIPGHPRLPIPSAKKGGAEAFYELPWPTTQRIEGYVTPAVNLILLGADDEDDEEKKEPVTSE